ncbi:Excisionase family DNA binding domain-containing protein [Desulfonema limicola]|uniref:Excisionase family DNA binding domain-containing protein n=1 Tax=Desulfonema limicola TaxID=45656 RepID=A0A975BBF6_9BACT|nr:helix-turn-helix domain-containing protein [Desulfonema limicola]QTA82343.1 Excisionase family DNA binding domain-containing protein [Desulfonema limicola]
MSEAQKLYTAEEADNYYKVKRGFTARKAREGLIKFSRVGRAYRFTQEALDEFREKYGKMLQGKSLIKRSGEDREKKQEVEDKIRERQEISERIDQLKEQIIILQQEIDSSNDKFERASLIDDLRLAVKAVKDEDNKLGEITKELDDLTTKNFSESLEMAKRSSEDIYKSLMGETPSPEPSEDEDDEKIPDTGEVNNEAQSVANPGI